MAGVSRTADATAPAHHAVAITENDSTVFPICRALYVGSTGNLVVRMGSGSQVTFTAVPVGIMPIQVDMVLTASTAGDIVALY